MALVHYPDQQSTPNQGPNFEIAGQNFAQGTSIFDVVVRTLVRLPDFKERVQQLDLSSRNVITGARFDGMLAFLNYLSDGKQSIKRETVGKRFDPNAMEFIVTDNRTVVDSHPNVIAVVDPPARPGVRTNWYDLSEDGSTNSMLRRTSYSGKGLGELSLTTHDVATNELVEKFDFSRDADGKLYGATAQLAADLGAFVAANQ